MAAGLPILETIVSISTWIIRATISLFGVHPAAQSPEIAVRDDSPTNWKSANSAVILFPEATGCGVNL